MAHAPFDTARVRFDLAVTLGALGREREARREMEAALAAFSRQLTAAPMLSSLDAAYATGIVWLRGWGR